MRQLPLKGRRMPLMGNHVASTLNRFGISSRESSSSQVRPISLYVDASGVEDVGAWAVILVYGTHEKCLSGYASQTTHIRMYLQALIEGLTALQQPSLVHIVTSSEYLRRGCQKGIQGTIHGRRYEANKDLWEIVEPLLSKHEVVWVARDQSNISYRRKVKQLVKETFGDR